MLVFKGMKILLMERANPPFGFAPPAGHEDAYQSSENAARQELQKTVGLETMEMSLVTEGRKNNPCQRKGTWHDWKIYEVKALGEIQKNPDEAKQAHWFDPAQIQLFTERTKRYLAGGTSEHDWRQAPGLELVWYEWFTEFGII
jgi:ADP-ribose pyrophosphatase YjhB (NUDIX family)